MKITEEWLREKKACSDGIEWFTSSFPDGAEHETIVEKLIKDNKYDWSNWLLTHIFTHKQNVMYAVYAAELVLPIFESKYPSDCRPRQAIKTAKNWLENPTDAAACAANSAHAAARAAARAAAEAVWLKIINYGLIILKEMGE